MKQFRRFAAARLLPAFVLLPAVVLAAPITFNTALPIADGEFLFRQQFRWLRSSDDPTAQDREVRAHAALSVLGYGVNRDLAFFAVVPYIDKTHEIGSASPTIKRGAAGVGDLSAFARYTFLQHNATARTSRLAAFGGLSAPTGDDDAHDNFGRLPPALQTGSGTWNFFGGLVATHQTLAYQLDGQLSYRENRENRDFEAGDETRFDLSWQHRLWPRKLDGGVPGFFYAVLELNVLHRGKNRLAGVSDPDSGGDTVWLSPGLQYVTRRWILETVVQKPVSQSLNGAALENDWIISAGFRVNF